MEDFENDLFNESDIEEINDNIEGEEEHIDNDTYTKSQYVR